MVQEWVNQCIHGVKKITLSANGYKRIQMPDGVISYPYGSGPGTVCKAGFMRHPKIKNLI